MNRLPATSWSGTDRALRVSVAGLILLVVLVGNFLNPTPIAADEGGNTGAKHSLWLIESATNRTYLMGSVHVLREQDYPLPQAFYDAYSDADQLVMEIDLEEIDPVATLALSRALAMLAEDVTLASVIGPENFQRASELAKKIDINLDLFARVEPWFAAMTISQVQLQRLGFKADKGIEFHFIERALRDNKPSSGLETMADQFRALDTLPLDSQVGFFLESLTDAQELLEDGEKMLKAWKTGDSVQLDELFADDLNSSPDLRQALLVERNTKWLPKIMKLATEQDDYLVIVGALHLVGEDGIIKMLRDQGLAVRQL